MAKKPKSPTEITSIRHKNDSRVNIPTEELRDFVAEDEKAPKAILYPRGMRDLSTESGSIFVQIASWHTK